MSSWRENIAQNLVASAIWAALGALVGLLVVALAKATPIIVLFAPLSYLFCVLFAWALLAMIAYVGARAWRYLYPAAPIPVTPPDTAPAPIVDEQAARNRSAIDRLPRVRDNAAVAVYQGSDSHRARVFHEVEAAMLAIEDRFGIPKLSGAEAYGETHGYRDVLDVYVRYIDTFYPLLRDGYVKRAKEKAAAFKNPFEDGPSPASSH